MTTNQIQLRNVKETERHNRATEGEDRRHNVRTEDYTEAHYERADQAALINAWAASSQADTAKQNAAINAINAETKRYEAETGRLSYQETSRHNLAQEELQEYQNVTNRLSQQEAKRHNQASESISYSQLNETRRHNEAYESIQKDQNALGWAKFGDQIEQEYRVNKQKDRELDIREDLNAIKREEIEKKYSNRGGFPAVMTPEEQADYQRLLDDYAATHDVDDDNGWWEQTKEMVSDVTDIVSEPMSKLFNETFFGGHKMSSGNSHLEDLINAADYFTK